MQLQLNSVTVSGAGKIQTVKPSEKNNNYYRQQSVFVATQKMTTETPYIDDVTLSVENKNASDRDKTATDILARPLNISGPGMLKGSDMEKVATLINDDDFKDGKLTETSDGLIKGFSKEKDGFGIVDKKGNVFKFDKTGKLIDAQFKTKEAQAAYMQELFSGQDFAIQHGEEFAEQCGYSFEDDVRAGRFSAINK